MQTINIHTLVFVTVFATFYLLFLIRKTARQQLDIYDLVMLSTVAILPSIFVYFPEVAFGISKLLGVEFPFVIMFGMLFFFIFIFVNRLIVKLHRLESDNRLMIQEISLLKQATRIE